MPALNGKRNLKEYISGYVDGEGSFCVSFSKRKKLLVGWETKPSLSVGQKEERANVLGLMQKEKHLHANGLRKIVSIACKMNPSGKRKYSKENIQKTLR